MQQGNLETRITSWLARLQEKADYEAKRNGDSTLKIGDVLNGSWGYEQTNQVFAQVVGIRGKTQVVIQKLKKKTVRGSGDMSAHVMPLADEFSEVETRVCTVRNGNSVKWSDYCTLELWNGKEQYETYYA